MGVRGGVFVQGANSPEHAAHEQQVRGYEGGVEQGGTVGAHAGQEGACAATPILRGPAQPQPAQVGAGPFPEAQRRDQLRGQG